MVRSGLTLARERKERCSFLLVRFWLTYFSEREHDGEGHNAPPLFFVILSIIPSPHRGKGGGEGDEGFAMFPLSLVGEAEVRGGCAVHLSPWWERLGEGEWVLDLQLLTPTPTLPLHPGGGRDGFSLSPLCGRGGGEGVWLLSFKLSPPPGPPPLAGEAR